MYNAVQNRKSGQRRKAFKAEVKTDVDSKFTSITKEAQYFGLGNEEDDSKASQKHDMA